MDKFHTTKIAASGRSRRYLSIDACIARHLPATSYMYVCTLPVVEKIRLEIGPGVRYLACYIYVYMMRYSCVASTCHVFVRVSRNLAQWLTCYLVLGIHIIRVVVC